MLIYKGLNPLNTVEVPESDPLGPTCLKVFTAISADLQFILADIENLKTTYKDVLSLMGPDGSAKKPQAQP